MHHTTKEVFDTGQREFPSEFAKDIFIGLTSSPKWLSSKYFYDSKGDEIFQQIMKMPSYYLTDCEFEIFSDRAEDILQSIGEDEPFRIIELGAGDGYKTRVLLEHFTRRKADFTYAPCDISLHVLKILETNLKASLPDLTIELQHGDYFKRLGELLTNDDGRKNIVFFLGANIGNFTVDRAKQFLQRIRQSVRHGDLLMIGFDLKKDPGVILNAYNDPEAITASFNLNLLDRINRELGGDFDKGKFLHQPIYNPETGECRSYLVSKEPQEVRLEALDEVITFGPWESIFMEISKKYDQQEIDELASMCEYATLASIKDRRDYFAEVIWRAI